MSSQKGNTSRTRPQKHQNKTVFKNNLHDTSHRTKLLNTIHVSNVCIRCKEIIEWKIKYKKYKPLTRPKTCVKCGQKNVKQTYHVICGSCEKTLGVCAKCCHKKEVVQEEYTEAAQLKLDNEMKVLIQSLPERKRRTFIRYMNKRTTNSDDKQIIEKDVWMSKLNALKIDDDLNELNDSDFKDSEEESEGT